MGYGECTLLLQWMRRGSAGDVAGATLPRLVPNRRLRLPALQPCSLALVEEAPYAGHKHCTCMFARGAITHLLEVLC
jgi:hypothetical protein